jgi:tol-pal system beta propeller repeat protein TolB
MAAGLVSGCATGLAGSPTYVTDVSATINGLVATSEGGAVSYWVEYGTTDSYGHESAHRSHTAAAKSTFLVSVPIAGLTAATTYHYRICAQDSQAGVAAGCGVDASFTTDSPGGRSGIAFLSNRGPGSPFTAGDVIVMNTDGSNPVNVTNSASSFSGWPAWSPDARQIAYTYQLYGDDQRTPVGSSQIHAMNANGSNDHALTSDTAYHSEAAWSPDGQRIAFTRTVTGGSGDIYVMDADGDNPVNLTNSAAGESEPAWSPDGRSIAFTRVADSNSLGDIYVMDADGGAKRPLTSTPSLSEGEPAWSPDGRRIAFVRNVGGSLAQEIFAIDPDGANPVDLTNFAGGESAPSWSPDGGKIAYANAGEEIFALDLATGSHPNLTNNNPIADFFPAWSPRP